MTPLDPVHPGEILKEEFLKPLGMSMRRLARRLHVSRSRVEKLIGGREAMSADTALRLERVFGSTAEFWMNLQASHDLAVARAALGPALDEIQAFGTTDPR